MIGYNFLLLEEHEHLSYSVVCDLLMTKCTLISVNGRCMMSFLSTALIDRNNRNATSTIFSWFLYMCSLQMLVQQVNLTSLCNEWSGIGVIQISKINGSRRCRINSLIRHIICAKSLSCALQIVAILKQRQK